MELLPFLFMSSCFLTLSRLTFGDESGKPVNVRQCDDAILPCSLGTNENIEHVRFEWTKEGTEKKVFIHDTGVNHSPALPGRVSHFPDGLQHGNASIRINNVRLKDGGIYTCSFPTSGKTFRIELVVVEPLRDRSEENLQDAVSKPVVSLLNGEGSLQCEVRSRNPWPRVEWWDNDNKTIQSEELQNKLMKKHNYTIVKINVSQSGTYRCVATQDDICHQIFTATFVPVGGAQSGTGAITAIALSVMIGFFATV